MLEGAKVTTIEGLGGEHPLQTAWVEARRAPVRLLPVGPDHVAPPPCSPSNPHPSDADIDAAMSGNICRCGTYQRIRAAIKAAAGQAASTKTA